MELYFPIAEMSINILLLLVLGGVVGMLSGIFGVGGGFLMTPLLIFMGVPPAVAVGTEANQVVAASVSGALAHWRRGNVDFKMGSVLLIGGFIGSSFGVWIFTWLRKLGQIDLVISLCFFTFLGIVGGLMVAESFRAWMRNQNPQAPRRKLHQHTWMHGLPFKLRFRKSKLYISALMPLSIGIFVGILSAIMGVGGGFIMVPAMIYLLGMPTSVVVGTSLFQIIFVTANVTFLQSVNNHTVDILLALVLVISSVIGAQIGTALGSRLRSEQLRGLLGIVVLLVGCKVGFDLVSTPENLFSFSVLGVNK
ncbi:MAG: sulfite exporter TauE/SafE family protein [Pseudomonadota bacterium]|nr:sulfite exporter TauE/SafE family protein [Pseudomonadota bacterium]